MSAALVVLCPHAVHQLPKVGACRGGELVAGMPQIMEVDTSKARCGEGGQPVATPEVGVAKGASSRTGEYERVVLAVSESGEMLAQGIRSPCSSMPAAWPAARSRRSSRSAR
jgi:hypothetical protein